MRFHPYSEVFPLIEGTEFDALVEDIRANGLREKIFLFEGKVLDGRNRYLACQKAKVRPAYRQFKGKDPLSFVVSLNISRRHLTVEQRAFAGAKIATLQRGSNQHTARAVSSQQKVAEQLGVSADSIQRARKVIEQGSKALQQAVESGDVGLKKAAAVVELPKSEQLAAATRKPEPEEPPREEWEPDEDAKLAAMDKEITASIEKVMRADDKLAAAHDELKRQAAEIAVLKLSRDGYMNGKSAMTRLLKAEQRKVERLEKQLKSAEGELEKVRERIAIMECAA